VLPLWTPIRRSQLTQALLLLILRIFGAWLVHFSTSPSLGRIFHMQFSRSVFICMILGSLTLLLLSAFCAICAVHPLLDY